MIKGTPVSERLLLLAEKWSNGTITPAEQEEFINWYNSFNDEQLSWPGDAGIKNELYNETIKLIRADETAPVIVIRKNQGWKKIAAAAAIIIAIALGLVYNFNSPGHNKPGINIAGNHHFPKPGYSQATLVLSNGQKIVLSGANEKISDSGIIIANNGSSLMYTETDVVLWNTMHTPRGGHYRVILPDGTKVWLNAASSIKFPTAFIENERQVEISGEVYFEVKKDPSKPFRVIANGKNIDVLGTNFNVSSYSGESFITTLLNGSVKIDHTILKPGQALTDGRLHEADTTEAVAWKNGFFQFNKTDLKAVMRQLERWYDLEIVYEGEIPYKTFVGELPRTAELAQVLRILSKTGLNYRMEGKKMIVTR